MVGTHFLGSQHSFSKVPAGVGFAFFQIAHVQFMLQLVEVLGFLLPRSKRSRQVIKSWESVDQVPAKLSLGRKLRLDADCVVKLLFVASLQPVAETQRVNNAKADRQLPVCITPRKQQP